MTTSHYITPEEAEYAFYSAIEGLNLEVMMAVWEVSDIIVCVHPMGPRLQGVRQVRESWRQIFNSNVQLRFRIAGVHRVYQDNLAFHVVYEHITVIGAEEQPAQPIIATNIYRRQPHGWHLVVHHASPGPVIGENHPRSGDQIH